MFVFLTLVLTVGYAVTGISGPEASIMDAETAYRAGRYAEAVRTLDMAERSLPKSDSPLRRRLLQKRADALTEVGNLPMAVRDLEALRQCYDKPQIGIENQRLELMVRMGKGQEALAAAHELLAKSEDASRDSRTVELLGEAAQSVYQKVVEDLKSELRQILAGPDLVTALRLLRTYAFREADDPVARRAKEDLEKLLARHSSTLMSAGRGQELVVEIQKGVAESQAAFRQALEIRGNPASAFLGFAYSLEQGGRDDDLIVEAEIYQRRFDNGYVLAAANAAADAHERHGRAKAVVELVDRVLPGESWKDRQKRDTLHPALKTLLLRKARAQHALGDKIGMSQTLAQAYSIYDAAFKDPRLAIAPDFFLIVALSNALTETWKEVGLFVNQFCSFKEVLSDRDDDHDALVEALTLWCSAIQKVGQAQDFVPLVKIWSTNRPFDPRPHAIVARSLLANGDGINAAEYAQSASKIAPRDEDILRLWAEAKALHYDLLQRGPKSLLQACLMSGTAEPVNVGERLLYMPLAELALRTGAPHVALACARRGQDYFTLASWPRLLYADAALALGKPAEAEKAMLSLLELRPDDLEAQRRLRKARAALGQPTVELLYGAMSDPKLDADLAGAIAKAALEREDAEVLPGIVRCLRENFPNDAESMLRVAEAYARVGREYEAKQILLHLPQLFPNDKARCAEAARRYVLLCARGGELTELALATRALLHLGSGNVALLTSTAEDLAALGRDAMAAELIGGVLEARVEPGQRSGRHFQLAGRLAIATGHLATAEDHLTAALAFKDGAQATRLLVPLLLALDRPADAAQAWWREQVDDSASACIALRLGLTSSAAASIEAWRKKDPTDLQLALLALAANPERPDLKDVLPDAAEIARLDRDALLECFLFCEIKGLEQLAFSRASAILARYPKSRCARWLVARAEARAGNSKDASVRLLALAADEPDFIPAVDELAWIVFHAPAGGYDSGAVRGQIVVSAARYQDKASPRIVALAGREFAGQLLRELGMNYTPGLDLLSKVWRDHPQASGAWFPEVEALVSAGRTAEALDLLDSLEKHVPRFSRPQFLDSWFKTAVSIQATNPDRAVSERMLQYARKVVFDEDPYGSALHFMIRMERAEAGTTREDEVSASVRAAKIRSLLHKQITLFETGRDPSLDSVLASLDEIEALDGLAVALAQSEAILRKNPALPQLWRRRAELLTKSGRPAEAIELLRHLWNYTHEPFVLLLSAELACEQGVPINAAETRLEAEMPGTMTESPRGHYVRGLLALRAARYDAAIKLFEGAEHRADGAHLWFAALAQLGSRAKGAHSRAMGLLQRLKLEYPKSLLSRNAEHFIAQLRLI